MVIYLQNYVNKMQLQYLKINYILDYTLNNEYTKTGIEKPLT